MFIFLPSYALVLVSIVLEYSSCAYFGYIPFWSTFDIFIVFVALSQVSLLLVLQYKSFVFMYGEEVFGVLVQLMHYWNDASSLVLLFV